MTSRLINPVCAMRALAFLSVFSLVDRASAEEGMFLPDKLPSKAMTAKGLKVPVSRISALSKAIVQVARGGSGSFVSKKGLLVTNHHVAYGCLARLDARKAHKGLMERGYIARGRRAEIHCPGYDLLVVDRMIDVTAKVKRKLPAGTRQNYNKRFLLLRRTKEALRVKCERDQPQRVCQVSEMDGGRYYYLSVYRRIRDVRLVYAPPKALGKFGGDIDNWMFPRHTADFTFLRAYVGKDGSSKGYAKDNVPLSTPVHLQLARWGVKKGSLVLVLGFPGRTKRHVTSHAVRYQQKTVLPEVVELLDAIIGELGKRREKSDDSKRKYAGLWAGLHNGVKYYRMSREGFAKYQPLKRKLAFEAALKKSEAFQKERGHQVQLEIGRVYGRLSRFAKKSAMLRWLTRIVPTMRVAYDIVRWGREKALPDTERPDRRYKDKNTYRFKEAAKRLELETELETEKTLLTFFVRRAVKLPRRQRVTSVGWLLRWSKKTLAQTRRAAKKARQPFAAFYAARFKAPFHKDRFRRAVDMMFGASKVVAHKAGRKSAIAYRNAAFALDKKRIAALKDPLLDFAAKIDGERLALRNGPQRLVERYLGTVLRPRWTAASNARYPDANFTLRLSYGIVWDYTASKTGKTHRYMTGLAGVVKKHKGKYPFDVPSFLRRAAKQKALVRTSRYVDRQIDDIPVNFTCTLDTTGGNSGSAVLDDHGRLAGLLFDGTPESILSDWQYLPKAQRSIVVDIRYALYLAKLQGAKRLLAELGQ
jgi:hypothetical protein